MRARTLALIGGAALVALGGVYLYIDVRTGAPGPSSEVLEQARLRHLRGTASGESGERPDHRANAMRPQIASRDLGPVNDSVFAKDSSGQPRNPNDHSPPEIRVPAARGDRFRRGSEPPSPEGVEHPDIDSALLEANKAYDRKDFETARELALAMLQKRVPGNVRMLRVVVSSSCILGDPEVAKKYAAELPPFDRDQMATRCAQYGITVP